MNEALITLREQQPEGDQAPDNYPVEAALTDMELYVSGLVRALDQGISEQVSGDNLSALDYRLLYACLQRGECTATQLAEVLPTDPSRISRIVNTLVEMGLLARRRPPEDRRLVILTLTESGTELISRLGQTVQDYYQRLLQDISQEDMRVFAATCIKLAENYEALRRG